TTSTAQNSPTTKESSGQPRGYLTAPGVKALSRDAASCGTAAQVPPQLHGALLLQTDGGRAAVPLLALSWSERYLKSRNDATLYTEAGAETILLSSINANIIG
ncbi:hypothetical protein M9458_020053, partial [Cirrhinus mrigala]